MPIIVHHAFKRDSKLKVTLPYFAMAHHELLARVATIWANKDPEFVYRKVAEVNALTLDDAYMRTNHIHSDWQEDPRVVVYNGRQHRSTSVGDVMIINNQLWMVATAGYEQVDVLPESAPARRAIEQAQYAATKAGE